MNRRINYQEHSNKLLTQLIALGQASREESLPRSLLDLVNIRASQINGCAFCLDMHTKEARLRGERELRIYHVSIWRESTLFSEKERAAFEWTEAVTKLSDHGISEEVFQRVHKSLTEKEMSDLTFAIGIINFFNRLNISSPAVPGSLDEYLGLSKSGLK